MLDLIPPPVETIAVGIFSSDFKPIAVFKIGTDIFDYMLDRKYACLPLITQNVPNWPKHNYVLQLTETCPANIRDDICRAVSK